jgi:hypothetical protein
MEDLWHEEAKRNTRHVPAKSKKRWPKIERPKARGDRVGDDASADGNQITVNGQKNFIGDLARFFRAFLMFRFAAARCFRVVTISHNRICAVGSSVRPSHAHLSDDAFVWLLLSSRQPTGNVPSVDSPRALRVSTMPALRRSDGSRV